MPDFVHLHVHTQYSLLDGAIKISKLMGRVSEMGMSAVAMTDHGNMYGAVDFQKSAKKKGVKSIIGCELYMTTEQYDAEEKKDPKSYHLTVLAKNHEGYKNLMYLNSMAWLKGVYPRTGIPRVDFELLAKHKEGLIVLSGDLGSEINQMILHGKTDEARELAKLYRDTFPPDHYYLEVMRNALPEQERCTEALFALSDELGIPLVATNDCHYLERENARAHAILISIQLGKTVDLDRVMEHGLDQLYVRSPEEMYEAFADRPEACENTVKIAEMCDLTIPLGQVYLPKYGVPEEFKAERGITDQDVAIHEYFDHVARQGLVERYEEFDALGVEYDKQVYEDRIQIEIDIIRNMDFPGYFLIVWDFINWAKQQGIPVGPGRGSGAGSLVAYSMRITNLDPIPYDLLFERFLNPERVSMPDFDIDFCMNRRGEVIQYVTEKYGKDNVGQIITYGQLKAKAVVRDVGRALGLTYGETDRLAKLVPDVLGISLSEALDQEPRLTAMRHEDDRVDALFDIALSLENLNRQAGMHAAGVVISEDPLWEYVPICRGANDEIVTQFAKNEVEEAGLVKFDFLGLKTLTVIETALELINIQRRARGDEDDFDIETIPMDDRSVFRMISAGDTTGVFQLESSGFQELLKKLKPDCFEDIVAAVALYRPGPLGTGMVDDFIDRKHGRKKVEYPHPWLADALAPTYGVMVYQEQVMQTARVMAGYSLGGADLLRRAMGKKKKEVMDQQKGIFVEGARGLEVPEEKAGEIFDLMAYFAGYGFNKCVVGSTEVTHAETGEVTTVKELFDARAQLDFQIHAIDDANKLVKRGVTDVVWNGIKPVFELTTKQGKKLRATGNHPLYTLDGWVNLEDLEVGDRVAAPRHLDVGAEHSWPEHELIAAAWLLSEGNTCHPSCLYFYNNRQDAIDDFAQAASQFQHSVARISTRSNGRMEVCVSTGRDTRFKKGQRPWNSSEAREASEEPTRSGMFEWARELGMLGKKADQKRIPSEIFELNDRDIALFLGRLWAGDGFVANATQSTPYYATSSEQLAADVQYLLSRVGIPSGVHTKSFKYRGTERVGYTVHLLGENTRERFIDVVAPHMLSREDDVALLEQHVGESSGATTVDTIPVGVREWVREGKESNALTWKELELRSGVSCKEFVGAGSKNKRGFRRATITKLGEALGDKRLERAATRDIFWDEIASIEPKGFEHTYDLTVEHDHNFVANGLIVHNSHSAAYALITYQTGFLKTHYKVEFMAALMTNDRDNTDKVVRFINEAKDMGIEVLPPDVNVSLLDFSVADQKIRFGLAAIKGVGAGVIESIIEARADGPFKSLYDFCSRVDLKKINKRTIEALVKSGAFDSIGPSAGSTYIGDHCDARARMLAAIPTAVDRGQKSQHDKAVGQSSLFGMLAPAKRDEALDETYPDAEPWSDKELLQNERHLTGFYVTGHPLDRFEDEISIYGVTAASDVTSCKGLQYRDDVTIAGVVVEYRERPLKSGNGRMAFLMLEDKSGQCEVLVFSSAFAENEEALKCNEPILIKGQYTEDGDEVRVGKVRASEVTRLLDARKRFVRRINIDLKAKELENKELDKISSILKTYPGTCRTHVTLEVEHEYGRGRTEMALPEDLWVEPTDELLTALERLFRRKIVRMSSS